MEVPKYMEELELEMDEISETKNKSKMKKKKEKRINIKKKPKDSLVVRGTLFYASIDYLSMHTNQEGNKQRQLVIHLPNRISTVSTLVPHTRIAPLPLPLMQKRLPSTHPPIHSCTQSPNRNEYDTPPSLPTPSS